jgi:hypothetical protein
MGPEKGGGPINTLDLITPGNWMGRTLTLETPISGGEGQTTVNQGM